MERGGHTSRMRYCVEHLLLMCCVALRRLIVPCDSGQICTSFSSQNFTLPFSPLPSPLSHSLLPPHSPLPTPHSPLPTPHSPLPTPHSPLPTPHSPLPTPHSPLPTPHSPLPTPHSPLPTPHSLSQYYRHPFYSYDRDYKYSYLKFNNIAVAYLLVQFVAILFWLSLVLPV